MLAVSIAGPGYHLIPRSSWSLLPCLRWAHIGRPAAGGATSAWAPERPDRAPPSRRRGCVLAWSNGQRIAGCYRRRVTQRSIRATTPAHTTTSAGTVAVSVKLAPSSAGPIAKMSNASRPAPQTKAGFGKLSIERPLNRAHISNNTRRGRKFGGPKDRLRTPLLAPNLWTPPSSDAAMALCKFRKFYMCSRGLLAAQSEASPRREENLVEIQTATRPIAVFSSWLVERFCPCPSFRRLRPEARLMPVGRTGPTRRADQRPRFEQTPA
jgi:hypothetical protein